MSMDPKLYQQLLDTFEIELTEQHQNMVDSLIKLEKLESKNELSIHLSNLFRISHNIKGASKSISNDKIASIAHKLEDLFSYWREKKHIPANHEIDECLAQTDNLLVEHRNFISNFKKKDDEINTATEVSVDEGLKIRTSSVEKANNKANEFVSYQLQLGNILKSFSTTLTELTTYNETHQSKTVETVCKQLALIRDETLQFNGKFYRSLQGLQDELQSMRLVPISHILIPLSRTVRDLAQSLKKSVQLKVVGGDIQIDKTILDLIKDPLNHLVRNAIDHGIETEEERKSLKKDLPATISIKVSHQSGKINIVFSDDGRGINIKKLKSKALKLGLFTSDEINKMSEREALDLIYHSGLSTQQNVSNISGRGVGLDAVRNNIRRLKGEISVASPKIDGASFLISLPLTLATTRALIIKNQNDVFILPTLSLNKLYNINISELKKVDNQYVYIIENRPIPVRSFGDMIQDKNTHFNYDNKYPAIHISESDKEFLILVEEVTDEHDCILLPMPEPLNTLSQYIGVTTITGEQLILALDPQYLLEKSAGSSTLLIKRNVQDDNKPAQTSLNKKRILIVDDSLTTRTLAINSLRAVGFDTQTANDGAEAWKSLQINHYDCIVTDIKMPNMDGFELTQRIKKNDRFKRLPIVIVTSLESDQDKERGLELGANAFLVKSQFDSRTLIETIGRLL